MIQQCFITLNLSARSSKMMNLSMLNQDKKVHLSSNNQSSKPQGAFHSTRESFSDISEISSEGLTLQGIPKFSLVFSHILFGFNRGQSYLATIQQRFSNDLATPMMSQFAQKCLEILHDFRSTFASDQVNQVRGQTNFCFVLLEQLLSNFRDRKQYFSNVLGTLEQLV